jgi:hypothetical protein
MFTFRDKEQKSPYDANNTIYDSKYKVSWAKSVGLSPRDRAFVDTVTIASAVASTIDDKFSKLLAAAADLSCDDLRRFSTHMLKVLPPGSVTIGQINADHVERASMLNAEDITEELERKYASVDLIVTPSMFHDLVKEGVDKYEQLSAGCTYFLGSTKTVVGYENGRYVKRPIDPAFLLAFKEKHGVGLSIHDRPTDVGKAIVTRVRLTLDGGGFSFKVHVTSKDELADYIDSHGPEIVAALNATPVSYVQFLDNNPADLVDLALSWYAPLVYRDLQRLVRARQSTMRFIPVVSATQAMSDSIASLQSDDDVASIKVVHDYVCMRDNMYTARVARPCQAPCDDYQSRVNAALDYGAVTVSPLRATHSVELKPCEGDFVDWDDTITMMTPPDEIRRVLTTTKANIITLYAGTISSYSNGKCFEAAAEMCATRDYRLVFSANPYDPYVLLCLGSVKPRENVTVEILYAYLLRQIVWSRMVLKSYAAMFRYDRYEYIDHGVMTPLGLPVCIARSHEYKERLSRVLTGSIYKFGSLGWRASDAVYTVTRVLTVVD